MIRIALAQINTTVGDLSGNIQKTSEFIGWAKNCRTDIVLFPELTICGYPPEDLLLKKHFIRDNQKALQVLIKKTSGITAVVGFVDKSTKGIYNAAAVISDKKLRGIYHKQELPNYGVFDEKRYFSPGGKNVLLSLKGVRLGLSICEDIWINKGVCFFQAKAGAKVLLNISSSPFHAGKIEAREKMLKSRAKEAKAYIGYVNLVGAQDELVFDGTSCVINPHGNIIARARQFEEDLVVTDLDIKGSLRETKKKGFVHIALARTQKETRRLECAPYLTKPLVDIEQIYQALVLGTRDYVQKNGFKKVVIGLSGGIDSSLTAVIACDAIGQDNVVGVIMSSQYSSAETQADAERLAKNLGIQCLKIPIQDIFSVYLKTLKGSFQGRKKNIAEENIQARIRGNILMALSNKFGWLVLTTGNKSEVAVGYCTLYGDMAGGFSILKDVFKTTVYKLVRFLNLRQRRRLIPQSIIDRAPTAELRANQKDQDALPPYGRLDEVLKGYVERDRDLNHLLKTLPHKLVIEVIGMVDKNEYKRRQAPIGIKITPKAFGKDRRMPITNKYNSELTTLQTHVAKRFRVA